MFGQDYLAGAKYQDVILKTHPEGWAAGFFAKTFGDALPVVDKLLSTGRCPHVRIQLLWSDTHSFSDKDIPDIKKEAARYEKLRQKYPHVTFELSPFCEHNLSNPDKYLDIVKESAPSCTPVNTPWKGKLSIKYKNEVHGYAKKPNGKYNYSFDGTSCVDADVTKLKALHSSSDVFFFWDAPYNLKYEDTDKTPRPKRTYKPSRELLESIIYLSTDKGNTSLPKNWLYKSHSETKPTPDPRRDKPVFIIPIKAKEILLKKPSGEVVEKLLYYGTFSDGRYRYYAKNWGYKIARVCDLCDVVVNGKIYGRIDPGFRDGQFR